MVLFQGNKKPKIVYTESSSLWFSLQLQKQLEKREASIGASLFSSVQHLWVNKPLLLVHFGRKPQALPSFTTSFFFPSLEQQVP